MFRGRGVKKILICSTRVRNALSRSTRSRAGRCMPLVLMVCSIPHMAFYGAGEFAKNCEMLHARAQLRGPNQMVIVAVWHPCASLDCTIGGLWCHFLTCFDWRNGHALLLCSLSKPTEVKAIPPFSYFFCS